MTNTEIILAVVAAVQLLWLGSLFGRINALERELADKASRFSQDSTNARTWGLVRELHALCRHLGVRIEEVPSSVQVEKVS